MMATGPFEILLILLLSFSPTSEVPPDSLAMIDPAAALGLLGHDTETATLEKLLAPAGEESAAPRTEVPKELESAIQNLASRSDQIRADARAKLVAAGASVRARLEKVVAEDARRADEAKKVLELIAGSEKAGGQLQLLARVAAVRHVGKAKLTALQGAVEKLKDDESPFVRSAVSHTLIQLGAAPKPEPSDDDVARPSSLQRELRALPAETNLLVATNIVVAGPGAESWLTLESMFARMAESMAGFPDAEQMMAQARDESRSGLLDFTKSYGLMSPRSVVVANVGSIEESGAGLAILFEGDYQPEVIRATASAAGSGWTISEVAGHEVLDNGSVKLVLLDGSKLAVLPQGASDRFPLESFLAARAGNEDRIAKSERMGRFVSTLEKPFYLRGLARTKGDDWTALKAELQSEAPPDVGEGIQAAEEVELNVRRTTEGKTDVRFEAIFAKAENAKSVADFLDSQIKSGIAELEQLAAQVQIGTIKTMIEIMKSLRVSAEGERGILRLTLPKMSFAEMFSGIGLSG